MTQPQIYLPKDLPCGKRLHARYYPLGEWKDTAGAERVLLLNLMPKKADTEEDICRTLARTGKKVQVIPIKISGQTYRNTPMEHMQAFYLDFEEVEHGHFDRLIITGAPLEQMPFEQVRYWPQLCRIMDWADTHAARTLYLCWGAQAGLYHHYGIQKRPLPEKMFGIFEQKAITDNEKTTEAGRRLTQGLRPTFRMPQSRHTEVTVADVAGAADKGLQLLAESSESGVGLAASSDGRRVFVTGHPEYRPTTLDEEYRRDLAKGLPIHAPLHYYTPQGAIDHSWSEDAARIYANFLSE